MSVNIIAVGKMGEKFYADAMREYEKRLGAYCKFKVTEISEVKVANEDSQALISAALSKEGADILRHITRGTTIAMCIEGKQTDSEGFAKIFSETALFGESQMNFVIGSSHGLSEEVKQAAKYRMSLSKMTLPHQLCRVVLTEQIYRAFKINVGEKYHK